MDLNTSSRDGHDYLLVKVGAGTGASAHLVASWSDEALYLARTDRQTPRALRPQPALREDAHIPRGEVDHDAAVLHADQWWPLTLCDKQWFRMLSTEEQGQLEQQDPVSWGTTSRPDSGGPRDITCNDCIQALVRRRPETA